VEGHQWAHLAVGGGIKKGGQRSCAFGDRYQRIGDRFSVPSLTANSKI